MGMQCTCLCCWQAGQLSQELQDKRAERAVARATANAYRQVRNTDIGVVLAPATAMQIKSP